MHVHRERTIGRFNLSLDLASWSIGLGLVLAFDPFAVGLMIGPLLAAVEVTRGGAVVARAAHNREVAGSSPAPASKSRR